MHRLMPALEQYLMYRNLDVSTVKELVKHWAPEKEEFSKEYAELYCLYSYTKITHSGFTCTPLASFGQSGEY